MKKPVWAWLAVALQLLVLLFMIAERELILQFGKTVYIGTQPVDPIDPFRGQYVRLSYDFNRIPFHACRDGLPAILTSTTNYAARAQWKDHRIYAVFATTPDGFLDFQYATDIQPATGAYLRGRIVYAAPTDVQARFGIEAFFVQQGQGPLIEAQRTRSDRIRIPLDMEVALSPNGIPVLKGFKWAPIGLGLIVTATNHLRRPTAVTLTFLNNADKPLALLDQGNGRPCRLMPQRPDWDASDRYPQWIGDLHPPVQSPIREDQIVLLNPQSTHTVNINLLDPAWYVVQGTNPPQSIADLDASQGFRFEYAYSPTNPLPALKNAERLWRGKLVSSAFWGFAVD